MKQITNMLTRRSSKRLTVAFFVAAAAGFMMAAPALAEDWRQFRGNKGDSIAPDATPPLEWTTEEVDWKVELPGRAVGGVIVVGDRLFTTSSEGTTEGAAQERLHLFCLDANTGQRLWTRSLWATGRTVCHPLTSMAAPTPASDGERVFALFATNDLACFDMDGNLLWFRALGAENKYAFDDRGLASSPLVIGDRLIVQIECQGDSFVEGFSTKTGATVWKQALTKTTAWTSPTPIHYGEKTYAVIQSADLVQILDPKEGSEIWRYETPSNLIPSPVAIGTTLFLPSRGLQAIDLKNANETVEPTWQQNRLSPGSASPVIANGDVLVVRSPNILSCGKAEDGEFKWGLRLEGNGFWATPVFAGGHLFVPNSEGKVFVVKPGDEEGEIVSVNEMDEEMLGSPAAVGDALYLRGVGNVYRVSSGS